MIKKRKKAQVSPSKSQSQKNVSPKKKHVDLILPIGCEGKDAKYESQFFRGSDIQNTLINSNFLKKAAEKSDHGKRKATSGPTYNSFSGVFVYDNREGWKASDVANPDYALYHANTSATGTDVLSVDNLAQALGRKKIGGKPVSILVRGNIIEIEDRGVVITMAGPNGIEIETENEDDRVWVSDIVKSFLTKF